MQKRLRLLDGSLTDYQVCMHHLPALVDLIEEMDWVIFCNDQPLDDPEDYVIQSGDVLVLSYVPDN